MTISAKQVMDLRSATGMPMMQCKRALQAEGGDYEKAVERLRKEGMKAAEKRADKEAKEGLVRVRVQPDGSRATLIAVACETEPVAKTDLFVNFADGLIAHVDAKAPESIDTLLGQSWGADAGGSVGDALTGMIGQIREKIEVASIARLMADGKGIVGGYQHHDQKQGAIVALDSEKRGADLVDLAKQLCMHIVNKKPTVLVREQVPAKDSDQEMRILREQLAEDPKMAKKPAEMLEKILEGRMGSFFEQAVLTEQKWTMDENLNVGQVLEQHGATVRAFHLAFLG